MSEQVKLSEFDKQILKARDVSVPLVAVRTADPAATVQAICRIVVVNVSGSDKPAPVVQWDKVRGFAPVNKQGEEAAKRLGGQKITNPTEALARALDSQTNLPSHAALIMLNANDDYTDPQFRQAIWNIRDAFKRDARTLYLMQSSGNVPTSLEHDVLVIDEPLPGPETLAEVVRAQYAAARLELPKKPEEAQEVIRKAVDAVAGLSAFAAEQAVALALFKNGINFNLLRERHRQMIENAKGLSVWRGTDKFDSLGGLGNFKSFGRRFLAGRYHPGAVLWIDEIEKALAGIKGDLTGISQDYLAYLLGFMQDEKLPGILLMGHPGTGKSALAKAMAGEAGIPCVRMDMGAMHGSLVGESQHAIRHALKVAKAISQGRLVVVATCNSVAVLPPELVNRFKWRFFVDLPDDAEKKAIWPIHRAKYEVPKTDQQPDDTDWNGREIEQACATAYTLNCTLMEAAETVVPIAESSKEVMAMRRNEAHGRYLSASVPGKFLQTAKITQVEIGGRQVKLRDEDGWVAPPSSGKPN